MTTLRAGLVALFWLAATTLGPAALAQCPEEPPVQNYSGGGTVACACFAVGEEAGSILDVPAADYPIEILRVGIGYGSGQGGQGDFLEQAIHIYEGALPNPGVPIFSQPGPVLTDGVINEFDLESLPGEIIVNSGPFTVTLEFAEPNVGNAFHGTAVTDGLTCTPGANVIFTDLGLWFDGCDLGITGNWVFYVVYRPVNCGPVTAVGRVPNGDDVVGVPLTIEPLGNNLLLSWDVSCTATDTDYEVYEGTIGGVFDDHIDKLCSTGGATGAFVSPQGASSYYLVVPTDGTNEGSYGETSAGPRPVGLTQCLPQQAGECMP